MKIKARIPTSMSDVSLEQYQDWISVAEKPDQAPAFLDEKLIQYMTGLPQLAVTKMNRKQYMEVLSKLKKMMEETPGFVQTFKMDGVEYGFIPHFERDVLFKEWVDLDLYMKSWATMHNALAILYRPIVTRIGERYTIEEYDHTQDGEKFKKLPLDIAMGAVLFFWTLARQLLAAIPKSLQKHLQKKEVEEAMQKNGAGSLLSTHSLEEISYGVMKLLPSHWGPHYYGLLTSATTKEKSKEV